MSQCGFGVSPIRATGGITTHFCANVVSLGTCASRILRLKGLKNLSGFSPESVKAIVSSRVGIAHRIFPKPNIISIDIGVKIRYA
jgi:hypothetical protein